MKIFATDVDVDAIAVGLAGPLQRAEIANDVSRNGWTRYFVKGDGDVRDPLRTSARWWCSPPTT